MEASRNISTENGQGLADALSSHLHCDVASLSILSEDVVTHRFADWDVSLDHLSERDSQSRVVGVCGGQERFHHSLGAN